MVEHRNEARSSRLAVSASSNLEARAKPFSASSSLDELHVTHLFSYGNCQDREGA